MSQTAIEPRTDEPDVSAGRWMVVIFNNDHTPVQWVVAAVMRATGCGQREAEVEVWEAERFGRAPVHFASKDECDGAAAIIASIGVQTEVSPEWSD